MDSYHNRHLVQELRVCLSVFLTYRHGLADGLVAAAVVHELVHRDLAVVVQVHRLKQVRKYSVD